MIRRIVLAGDPVLRRRASEVEAFDARLRALGRDMVHTMLDAPGVGLAAPQVGEGIRLVILGGPLEPPMPVVNPVLSEPSGSEMGLEGCLSIPELRGMVPRATSVRLTGQDLLGQPLDIHLDGYAARIAQHEVDHLDGVLFLDRMLAEERDALLGEARANGDLDDEGLTALAAAPQGLRPLSPSGSSASTADELDTALGSDSSGSGPQGPASETPDWADH